MGGKIQELILDEQVVKDKIYTIRGKEVMLDRDLAELYAVETKRINEAVKNNPNKFPQDFYFELYDDEFNDLKSKISTANFSKVRINPKVFTEQGVYMLATVLKSKIATEVTISIMRTFTKMKLFLSQNSNLFQKIEQVEKRQLAYEIDTDKKIDKLFKALESKTIKPTQGIFFDGQIFDAYKFVNDLIKSSKNSIILIDNYIDESTLTLFSKIPKIKVTIYTKTITKQLQLDMKKYNQQYSNITLKTFKNSHDRFLIIDDETVYHIGASLKDLGKKWFAFSKMQKDDLKILDRLEDE